ncbi:MAG: DUF4180 domain-containing protein [Amphiplicatus sp.]
MNSERKYGRPPSGAVIASGVELVEHADDGLLLIRADEIAPAFFDLKSGVAGDILQKAVNYRLRVAILLDARPLSDRFAELVREHRAHPAVRFFNDEADALRWLAG